MAHQSEAIKKLVERAESKLGRYQNPKAQSLLAEQKRILNAVEAIDSMRRNPSSLETPAAHVLKLSKAAAKLQAESANIKHKLLQTYGQYSAELGVNMFDRLGIKENNYASEIRAMYRSLDNTERLKFIQDAVDNRDGATFAAVMLAPSPLTGIPRDMNQKLTDNFLMQAVPEMYQEQKDLQDAIDNVLTSADVAGSISNELQNPDAIRLIEQEVQKAQAAAEQFNSALG